MSAGHNILRTDFPTTPVYYDKLIFGVGQRISLLQRDMFSRALEAELLMGLSPH